MGPRAKSWLLAALSALAGLVMAEGLARVVPSRLREDLERRRYMAARGLMQLEFCEPDEDPLAGWRNIPGKTGVFENEEFRVSMRFNRFGLRGGEIEEKPAPGRPRVLLLGDSHTAGWGVEEEQTFAARLGRARPDLEILNAGVPGYGTRAEERLLDRLGPALSPAEVVLVFHQNDPEESYFNIRWHAPRPQAPRFAGLYLPAFAAMAVSERGASRAEPYWRRTDPKYEAAAAYYLHRIDSWCRERGVRLLVAYLPAKDELADREPAGYRLGLARFCERERIRFVDLTPALLAEDEPRRAYFRLDDHLNARGHALVAEALGRELAAAR